LKYTRNKEQQLAKTGSKPPTARNQNEKKQQQQQQKNITLKRKR